MKFIFIAFPLLVAASALAQGISIVTPTPGQSLKIGSSFTVKVEKANSIAFSQSISVAIGLQLCGEAPCSILDNDGRLGQILSAGDYNPQRHEVGRQPYQNYTVTIPSDLAPQSAVLHVIHFWLLGAGPFASLQAKNVSVTLAARSRHSSL